MSDALSVSNTEERALYCPACAYDVRFTMEDRCPECGTTFDRGSLGLCRIPWVRRARIGRTKAFFQTLAFGIRAPKRLAQEVAAPVSWHNASRFRWTVVWVATLFIAAAVGCVYPWIDLKQYHVDYNEWADLGITTSEPPMSPLAYPFVVLWTGPGLIIVITVGAFLSSAAMSWWFRTCFWMFGGKNRDRASAISLYAFGGWLPNSMFLCGILCVRIAVGPHEIPEWMFGTLVGLQACVYTGVGIWMFRTLVLLKKSSECRIGYLALAACAIPLGMIVATIFCTTFADYSLGLASLIVMSLQH